MDWNDVRFFLALSRLGSVRAAGASLGVSHSTVARRVEALEDGLSTRLFDRSRDGYSLTAAGTRLLSTAQRVERELSTVERELAGRDERCVGPVHVTCCDAFVSAMLIEDSAEFCRDHPGIELGITNDSRSFDLSRREADIAVRTLLVDQQPDGFLLGRKLVPMHMANYVAIAHADRLDPSIEGSEPRWLGVSPRKYIEMMVARSSYPDVPIWGDFSSLALLLQATRAGLGIVKLPCYAADPDPLLRRLGQPDLEHVANLWLVCHQDLRDNARCRAARECISLALMRREALFAGRSPQHGAADHCLSAVRPM